MSIKPKDLSQGPIPQPPVVLTIAGSDSGGAAGMQADLKTFTTLGVYGLSALTAVTAQNSARVANVKLLEPSLISLQIETVLSDYGAQAVKSGFIGSADAVQVISTTLLAADCRNIVVDPVLVNHQGISMFDPSVATAYINDLFPIADLITPNLPETQLLVGCQINSLEKAREAAETLRNFGAGSVLLKGWREADHVADLLFSQGKIHKFESGYIDSPNTHGSGDALSAAICAFLARGFSLLESVEMAHNYTYKAIENAAAWRLGSGHGPLYHGTHNLP